MSQFPMNVKFRPQSTDDVTGGFHIEEEGFGLIAVVDPCGSNDPEALRNLLCASAEMFTALKWLLPTLINHPDAANFTTSIREVRAAIAKAEGRKPA